MAKEFIKTIYVTSETYGGVKRIEKIDLYETDCFIIYKTTTIDNKIYEKKDKKATDYFEKYSWAKKYLATEFDQTLCDEFERQSEEYRKQIIFGMEQSKAKYEAFFIMNDFKHSLQSELEKFKGDWVEFAKKIDIKTNEMYQDFLKFMKENN